jgi:dihydropteroate synthase
MITPPDIPLILSFGSRTLDLSKRTAVMGILNVTPDSFSDGGAYPSVDAAVARAVAMVEEGADIIDIGGESTRPVSVYGGSTAVSAEEEMQRVIPVIERLAATSDVIISIDTTKSAVADAALRAGAHIVNDISGLNFDPAIADVTAAHHAALVVMHIQGTPETMQIAPQYEDVVGEVKASLAASATKAKSAGVRNIIIDPGIGFGKTTAHNLELLRRLSEFRTLGFPVMIGTSRKGFIGQLLGLPVEQRLEGTAATVAVSVMNGASIVRVHDVKEMKRVVLITDAINHAG